MPDLLDQYLAGEKEKEPDLLEQYLATKPIEEEVPAKEPTWWEAAFAPPKEYEEVYAPELGKMVPGERAEIPLGTKIIERLKFEWESDWPQWLGLGIYLGTYGVFKYVPIRGETLINRAAKSFAKNNLAALQKRAPDVINTLDDATTYSEMGLKQKLYQATADMKGGEALKTITKVTDFVSKQKLPAPETLPMLAQKITGVPSVALTDKLVHAGLDKVGAEALAGSMNLMKEGINKLVVGQVIDDFVDRSVARTPGLGEDIAPLTAEEKLGFSEMREALDKKVTDVLEAEQKPIEPIPKEVAPEVAPKAEIPEVKPEILAEEIIPGVEPPTKPPIPPTPPPREMPEFAGEPVGDPVTRLNELIKAAKPLRGKLEKAYTAERGKRIAALEESLKENIEKVGGEKAWEIAVSKLKGPLAPKEMKFALEPVKDKLTQEELDSLYSMTLKHPYLAMWEKTSAIRGLTKLFEGQIPQPKELVLLEEVYGTNLIKNILRKRAWGIKAADLLIEGANVPRALRATADMSYLLRQAIIPFTSHPVITGKMWGKSAEFGFSPKGMREYYNELPKHRWYKWMREFKVALIDPEKGGMAGREEPFMSRFVQKVPILKIPVGFAERAHTGGLTKLRVDLFSLYADDLISKGFSPTKDPKHFQAVSDVVNTFSGRGNLGEMGNRIAPALNVLFWSPRLQAARFNALNPVWYAKQPKEVRKKAMGDLAKSAAVLVTTVALIKVYADATGRDVHVEWNPLSTDWGKVRIGNTRYDIFGGHQQWIRMFAQLIMGERKSTETGEIISLTKDEWPFTTRKETAIRFVEGKLSPVAGLLWNEAMGGGKTWTGEEITAGHIAEQLMVPMWIEDVADAYREGDLVLAAPTAPIAFFGAGVQTWLPRKKKRKRVTY